MLPAEANALLAQRPYSGLSLYQYFPGYYKVAGVLNAVQIFLFNIR